MAVEASRLENRADVTLERQLVRRAVSGGSVIGATGNGGEATRQQKSTAGNEPTHDGAPIDLGGERPAEWPLKQAGNRQ